ncbi:MAG: DUF1501 domain-containing protein [Acetobacteraceae bacterium]|nr:DUF1501 domain-containing protein [Acetobacteraceae bacterium]
MAKSSGRLDVFGRRAVVRAGMFGLGLGVVGWGATPRLARAAAQPGVSSDRILVVVELSGANDGLNTVIPYSNDAYYKARPKLGIRSNKMLRIDEQFAFQRTMTGFERLYKDGNLAIVHGVGYEHPSFSHFTSMAYWHTGAPNSGNAYGWLGRLADKMDPDGTPNFLVNVESHESLAVRSHNHVPLVFDNPEKFLRGGLFEEQEALLTVSAGRSARNPTEAFLSDVANSAQKAEVHVREACANYRTPVDYGLYRFGLERVAALIAAGFPSRIYYVAYPNNAFDTHVTQADTHARILTYTSDHISAFMQDMARIGRGDDVALMVFSEFGRRVAENANLGTDHGTASVAFVAGRQVRGGQYGSMPSLTDLDDGNMRYTLDFRQLYATMIQSWMGSDAGAVLNDEFATLGVFGV